MPRTRSGRMRAARRCRGWEWWTCCWRRSPRAAPPPPLRASTCCLSVEVLEHRLDDQVGAGEAAVVGAAGNERAEPLELGTREPAALEPLGEQPGRRPETLSDPDEVGILEPGIHLDVEYRGARDPRAHEARADDAEAADLPRHGGAGRDAVVLLERRGGEEDLHQLARHVTHGQLAERTVLGGESGGDPLLQADAHRLERPQRSRVVAAGLGQHLLLGRAVDHAPAGGGAVERPVPAGRPRGGGAARPRARGDRRRRRAIARRMLGGTSSSTSPSRSALAPRSLRPVRIMSSAARAPMSRGRRWQPPAPGNEPELHLGQAELGLGMVGGDAVVAGERQLEPGAEAGAVDGGDDRLGQRLDPAHHLLPLEAQPLGRASRW